MLFFQAKREHKVKLSAIMHTQCSALFLSKRSDRRPVAHKVSKMRELICLQAHSSSKLEGILRLGSNVLTQISYS